MSTDWHTFRTWLLRHGMAEPDEAWEVFEDLAHESSHADDLEYITHAVQPLPHVMRLPILTGVAGLMSHLELSVEVEGLCRQLGTALDGLLAELDLNQPATIASTLVLDPPGRQVLSSWILVVQAARVLVLSTPRSEQIMPIAVLCNVGLQHLVFVLNSRLQQNPVYAGHVTSRFGYSLTLYTDAVRRLNDELGVVMFAEPPPLGAGVNAS